MELFAACLKAFDGLKRDRNLPGMFPPFGFVLSSLVDLELCGASLKHFKFLRNFENLCVMLSRGTPLPALRPVRGSSRKPGGMVDILLVKFSVQH